MTSPGAHAQERARRLSHDECVQLLRTQAVARLVVADGDCPLVRPVNYAWSTSGLHLRLGPGRLLQAVLRAPGVVLEVDVLDPWHRTGWSVVVRGTCRPAAPDETDDVRHAEDTDSVDVWEPGVHEHRLVVVPTLITGRQVGVHTQRPPGEDVGYR